MNDGKVYVDNPNKPVNLNPNGVTYDDLQGDKLSVDVKASSKLADVYASYAYDSCMKDERDWIGKDSDRSCREMVKTWYAENGERDPKVVSDSYDYGICQVNLAWHSDWINSDGFESAYKQMDYCLNAWIKAGNEEWMPWH